MSLVIRISSKDLVAEAENEESSEDCMTEHIN